MLTPTERKNFVMKFRQAKKEAKVSAKELYSLGDMALFDIEGALHKMSSEEFISNKKNVDNFLKNIEHQLEEIELSKTFDLAEFNKKYNKIGLVMSWASTNFDYDNPLLDFVGEEV